MLAPVLTSHASGRFCPSATPDASGPRNDGQLPLAGVAGGSGGADALRRATIRRSGFATTVPAGRQVLRSRIIRRGVQGSATIANVSTAFSCEKRYWPG